MRGGLVGQEIGDDPALELRSRPSAALATTPMDKPFALRFVAQCPVNPVVDAVRDLVQVAAAQPALDAVRIHIEPQEHAGAGHGRRQRLGAAHAAQSTRDHETTGQVVGP